MRGGGRGVLVILHAEVMAPLTSHPFQVRTEHAGVSPGQARNHKARSIVTSSASRMRGDLPLAKIVRPEAY